MSDVGMLTYALQAAGRIKWNSDEAPTYIPAHSNMDSWLPPASLMWPYGFAFQK